MHRLAPLAILLFVAASPVSGQREPELLVHELVGPSRQVREAAAKELVAMGADALPVLDRALADATEGRARHGVHGFSDERLRHQGFYRTLPFDAYVLVATPSTAENEGDGAQRTPLREQGLAVLEVLEALGQTATPTIPTLVRALAGEHEDLARRAAQVLTGLGAPAVPALTPRLQKGERWLAASVLAQSAAGRKALREALSSKRKDARLLGAFGLGKAPHRATADDAKALLTGLGDGRSALPRMCAWSLGRLGERAAPELCRTIREGDSPVLRAWAITALGRSGAPSTDALWTLTSALGDTNPLVAHHAARALATLTAGTPHAEAAAKSFVTLLDSEETDVHHGAIDGLARLGPAAADGMPRLAEFLREGGPRDTTSRAVLLAAARAGKVAAPIVAVAKEGLVESEGTEALFLLAAVAGHDEKAMDRLVSFLGSDGKTAAAGILAEIAHRNLPAVVAGLERTKQRETAAMLLREGLITQKCSPLVLASLGDASLPGGDPSWGYWTSDSVPALLGMLDHPHISQAAVLRSLRAIMRRAPEHHTAIATAMVPLLGTEDTSRVLALLHELPKLPASVTAQVLESAKPPHLALAFDVLGRHAAASPRLRDLLLAGLKSENIVVQRASARALGNAFAGDPATESPLAALSDHGDPSLRIDVDIALLPFAARRDVILDRAAANLSAAGPGTKEAALRVLRAAGTAQGTRHLEAIVACLHDTRSEDVRIAAAEALGEAVPGLRNAAHRLQEWLTVFEEVELEESTWSTSMGPQSARMYLQMLKSKDPKERVRAIGNLVTIDTELYREYILPLAKDPAAEVRKSVMSWTLLWHWDEPLAAAVRLGMFDTDDRVRAATAQALGQRIDDGKLEAATMLRAALMDPATEVRAAAVRSLTKLGEDDVRVAIDVANLLRDREVTVRRAAAESLQTLTRGGRRVDKQLVRALGDKAIEVAEAAATALGRNTFLDETSRKVLRQACEDPRPKVRAAALCALVELESDRPLSLIRIVRSLEDSSDHVVQSVGWALNEKLTAQ